MLPDSSSLYGPDVFDERLDKGPTSLARQVAQDAVNGARLAEVADCYYFLYARLQAETVS